ncbi:MAG: hypothetical protein LUC94_06015 [Clostridiales bacterium]|nr:hypothetical protein [Clostridiales bacterium]
MASLEEDYIQAENRMKKALQGAEDVIRYYGRPQKLEDKTGNINRGCKINEALNKIMDEMPKQELQNRALYFHEVEGILNALCLSQGLITEDNLPNQESFYYYDKDWVLSLAQLIEDHWDMKKRFMELDTKTFLKVPE